MMQRSDMSEKNKSVPDDAEKKQVWKDYFDRHPTRVPLRWNVNPRIVLLNPALNPEGWTFEGYVNDPEVHIRSYIRFQEYVASELSRVSDTVSTLPACWGAPGDVQNVAEAAYFGGSMTFRDGQVPGVESFLTEADFDDFLKCDFSDVLANSFIRNRLAFLESLRHVARSISYRDRPVQVNPLTMGFDGPVTVAAAIFGTAFFLLLGEDPEEASRLIGKITKDAIHRNRVLRRMAGHPEKAENGFFADDSIQLIGLETYEKWILPWHAYYYDETYKATPSSRNRSIHLCGDATRHFKLIRDRLGVVAFDTGFPVDHGWLRRELGPDVEVSGGPHVSLLQSGSPAACAAEAERILTSGVMAGGRFILQEGNNLPPCVPLENLAAVYEVCRTTGRYA
jgi:uroporphyrinogen-III decarboxylase